MKKISLSLFIFTVLYLFISCSSDDINSDNENSIMGKWQLASKSIGEENENLSDCEQNQTMEFFTNGTVENYFVDNDPCDFSTIYLDYSTNGNILTFSIDGEGMGGETYVLNAEIETLTDNVLIYTIFSDNEIGDYPESIRETYEYYRLETNETVSIDPEVIIGEWEYYTQEYRDYGDFSELPYLVTGCAADRYYKYNSDGTVDRFDYESITSNSSEDIEVDGYMIRNPTCVGDLILRGSRGYEIEGNKITWVNSDQSLSISIIEKLDEEQLITLWNDNLTEFSNWKARTVYNRK